MRRPRREAAFPAVGLIAALLMALAPGQALATSHLAGVVFSEIEKRVIREALGALDPAKPADAQNQHGKADKADKGKKSEKAEKSKGGKAGKEHGKDATPHGLAKRDAPPPGHAKQLERNGTLPPGLAKRDLPPDVLAKLPGLPAGLERVIVGDDVVLVEMATQKVLDVIVGVLRQ